nr:MAG TPA: Ribosome assembly 1 protein, Protein BINDING [Caudoviricetes sp.]
MRNCLSLNTPLTAGISREQTETTSNEALLTGKERSTTIPKGSRTKPSEMGSENTKIWRFIKKYP